MLQHTVINYSEVINCNKYYRLIKFFFYYGKLVYCRIIVVLYFIVLERIILLDNMSIKISRNLSTVVGKLFISL